MPQIEMDGTRISQVVNNLLENAIRHTPDGGQVAVTAGVAGDRMVRVAVADTGSGIPAEDLGRVFDRFFRSDHSRTRATGGVGLGLTIAKRLVEVHGENLEIISEPVQGTTVTARLPQERVINWGSIRLG